MSKMRVIALGVFMVFGAVAMVMPPSEEAKQRREADLAWQRKVDARTVTLGEWDKATPGQKAYFCNAYTRAHLGHDDPAKAGDVRKFLDGSASQLRKSATDPRVVEAIFERQQIWTQAKAGARLMGWPKSQDAEDDG